MSQLDVVSQKTEALNTRATDKPPDHALRTLLILSLLMAFASISTDLYLPAMPEMAQALNISAGTLQFTVTGYLIGFSAGQLFWGPISDRFGRKLPVAIGLILFITGSAGCAMATDGTQIIIWRVVQALGACANVVLARAMVRDIYEGREAAQKMSTLMTIMAIAPLAGPTLGGQILRFGSWQAIFWSLVLIAVVTLISLSMLPETLPRQRRSPASLNQIVKRYGSFFRDSRFLSYTAAGAFFYAGTFAYIAASPFAYITYYHISPQFYGLIFAGGIIGMMVTAQINARLLQRYDTETMLRLGALVSACAGLILVVNTWADWGGLPLMIFACLLFVAATGLVLANSVAGALNCFPDASGSASALVGALQYGSAMLGSAAVAFFANGSALPLGSVVAVCGTGCLLCALSVPRASAPGLE
ncbi:Bcr/CflA family multidrug efflux MFS transporter [Pseudomonas sp. CDFA 602]|uniref:Bcr/CflA family multidrug efflux MFS transporter n=1 Tax=Pseudomonas californiensis TaxID=2829823 RepID=UPI001E423E99|nr:Bcr/CflA family multidrug efflux MFS transporter [Pseudomonas californiensis]MCD5996335.1 Bcr/CflA family multidrug efflux MFS transporter [Pseudomonas californiensis]MCD6001934.1 Bcr/CflA family multidrug efflux MFS transporter [Pseudomonas californiensis]